MAIDSIGENALAAQRAREAALRRVQQQTAPQGAFRSMPQSAGIDQLAANNPRGPTRNILSGAPQNPAANPVDRDFAQARAEQNARFSEQGRMEAQARTPRATASIAQPPTQPLTRMQKVGNFMGSGLKANAVGALAGSAIGSGFGAIDRPTEDYDKRFGAATEGIDSLANWSQDKLQRFNNWSGLSNVAPSLSAKVENLPQLSAGMNKRALGVLSDVGADIGDTLLPGTPLRDSFADTQKPTKSIADLINPVSSSSIANPTEQRTQAMNVSPVSQGRTYGEINGKPITEEMVKSATQHANVVPSQRSIADIETTGGTDSLAAYQQQMANQNRQNNLSVDTGHGSSVQDAMERRMSRSSQYDKRIDDLLTRGKVKAATRMAEAAAGLGKAENGGSTEPRRQGQAPSIEDIASANRADAETDMARLNTKRQERMQSLQDQYLTDPQSEEGQSALKSIYALEGKGQDDKIIDVEVPLVDKPNELGEIPKAKGAYSASRGLVFDPRQMLAPQQQAAEGGQKTPFKIAKMPDGTRRQYFSDGTFEVLQ